MRTAIDRISDWRHALIALAFAALALLAAVFVPEARWEKLGALAGRIAEDPAGAAVIVGVIGGAITTLRGAWMRTPPPAALALVVALAASQVLTSGCGASALQTHATIGTVAAVAVASTAALVPAGCDAALTACHGEAACVDRTADECRAAGAAHDAARAGVSAYLDAIEVASLADENAVMPSLLVGLAGLVRLWTSLTAALAPMGVALPPLPPLATTLLSGAL